MRYNIFIEKKIEKKMTAFIYQCSLYPSITCNLKKKKKKQYKFDSSNYSSAARTLMEKNPHSVKG